MSKNGHATQKKQETTGKETTMGMWKRLCKSISGNDNSKVQIGKVQYGTVNVDARKTWYM